MKVKVIIERTPPYRTVAENQTKRALRPYRRILKHEERPNHHGSSYNGDLSPARNLVFILKGVLLPYDVFISYSWSEASTVALARSLAAHLRHAGFTVGIDIDVDYGSSLSAFMKEISESRHVLMIADEEYIIRANSIPKSGVGIENRLLQEVIDDKPDNWLSVAFVNQRKLPDWLEDRKPKRIYIRHQRWRAVWGGWN